MPGPKLRVDARAVATGLGAGRAAIGVGFLLAPTFSVRLLGVDAASAKRMTFLARMAAVRDLAVGAGTLASRSGRGVVPWLIAGAAADAVDALVIAGAIRSGPAGGIPAAATAAGAAAVVPLGVWAAAQLRDVPSS